MTAACLFSARAAIPVGSSGSGVFTFNSTPTADQFATAVLVGNGATYNATTGLDAGVATVSATNVTRTLPTSTTIPPSSFSGGFRHNNNTTSGFFIQSRPTTDTTNAANILVATLTNVSGSAISTISLTYTFNYFSYNAPDTLIGLYVYYSLTGEPGSWQPIPFFTGNTNIGVQTANVNVGTWANNTALYLLWADDNADDGGTDTSYSIDDFSVVQQGVVIPLSATLSTPTNGTVAVAPANVPVSVTTAGSTPPTSVTFYTNNVQYAVVTTQPYNAPLSNLAVGTYAIYARAVNGTETAFTTTNVVTVRQEFVNYGGGTITENFDSMGEFGTHTPIGWYVGTALPANSIDVLATNGMVRPADNPLNGFNFGNIGSGERSLGTEATGGDRNIVLRLRNNTSSNIVSFEIRYDGETWRTYTNAVDGWLTNLVSFDLGSNWIATGFDYDQTTPRAEPTTAVDGNDAANRTANIGGVVTPPTPVPPGGVIYIRWEDFNGTGVTDGGLAIDNFSFTATFNQFQPFVNISSPTNGQAYAAGAPITITAVGAMSNPITNVAFLRDGGTLIGNDTTAPYSVVYSNAAPGNHTLVVQARDSLGNQVTAANIVNITVNPNIPPSITLTNPADTSFLVGANITNFVTATDSDGTIAHVDYYVDGFLVYTDATPAKFEYADAKAGTHIISAIAVDNLGATASNGVTINVLNPPGVTLLLTNGATWKYFDEGTDPGATWNLLAYNDTAWSNGVAEIGFGDNAQDRPERTVLRRIAGATNTITYYFRRQVVVTNLASFSEVQLHLMADDGAAVYINGAEVYRTTNLTAVPLTFTNLADADAPDDGAGYHWTTNLNSSVFVAGTNIIGVEVHQNSLTSSDVSFDLMLWGGAAAGPRISITRTSATQAELAWPDSAVGYLLEYKTDLNAASWTPETALVTQSGGYFRATVNTASGNKYWRLHKP